MKILFLGNNYVGVETLRWLTNQDNCQIVGVIRHDESKAKYGAEISTIAERNNAPVFEPDCLTTEDGLAKLRKLGADMAISVFFGYILREPFLEIFAGGCINLHPSLLPFNRGANPNIWSLIDGTPSGVSIHYVDKGIDTGDIIAQQQVSTSLTDTGETLYRKLESVSIDLFKSTWPSIERGENSRTPQDPGGTTHKAKDVSEIDRIDLDQFYQARDLINRIRARTFPPYNGTFIEDGGKRYYLELKIREAHEQ